MSTDTFEHALITGASGGIGFAAAKALIERGYNVSIGYHKNKSKALELAQQADAQGCCSSIVSMDISCEASVRDAVSSAVHRVGPLTILVNCVGIVHDGGLLTMSLDAWTRSLAINLSGAFILTREVGREMSDQRYGRIVHVSSIAAVRATPGQSNYAAAKAGLDAFTRNAALELGPFGVTVNTIAPGIIETPMSADLNEHTRRRYLSRIPVRRFGLPEEITPVILMLISRETAYLTGQVINVDGGLTV